MGAGVGGHPHPEIMGEMGGGGGSKKKFFSALRASVCSNFKGRGLRGPGPSL